MRDSPPRGFGKSSATSGELVGSGPEGAGRTIGLENCGLDAGLLSHQSEL